MTDKLIHVFIGYDYREAVAYNVLAHSIQERSSQPVSITPIRLSHLKQVFTRERDPLQSSDFSFSRFLTPWLSDYTGWSVFMDCDMLMLDDIANLWALRDDNYAVMCVQHNHVPKETTKFLGEKQTKYAKKNWSSVMLFNNERCKALTPEYVNTASGLELHQFKWLSGDELIGELPQKWNYLVGYTPEIENISLAHYTVGGPYFKEFENCELSKEWFYERDDMLTVIEKTHRAAR